MQIELQVNGEKYGVDVEPDTPLLWVLRDELGLYGCGIGACGCCSVHIDGALVRSCTVPVESVRPTQQLESGVIMGLSAALGEKISTDKGRTVERNFSEYNILRLADTPKIEVHFVDSGGPLGGLGEPGTPPAAPALANAIFSASARRIRELPIGAVSTQ
jgi:hypothetical protein